MLKIGTPVIDRHGCYGTVRKMYDDFSAIAASCLTMGGEEWLAEQEKPFTKEHLYERWYLVECDEGGSVWSPESELIPR